MEIPLGTKIFMLYWRDYVIIGCAKAGFHCISFGTDGTILMNPTCHQIRCLQLNGYRMIHVLLPFTWIQSPMLGGLV